MDSVSSVRFQSGLTANLHLLHKGRGYCFVKVDSTLFV